MDFINFHIAYLLTKYERVIIPDFGAFVVSKGKEDAAKKRRFISPPANHSLTFNPEIIQNDELLVHSIAKEKNVDYEEALRLVYEYVDNLVDNLRKGETVRFPWIGKIHLSDDRKIVFTPAMNLSCNASSCGLVNLNFPYLNEASEDESTEKHKKTKYKRPVFYIILAVIVLLLVLSAIFLISNTWNKNLFSLSNTPTVNDTLKINSIIPVIDTLPPVGTDSIKPEIVDSLKAVIADDSTRLSPEYFIIIASFTKKTEADVMLHYFVAKGLNTAKIIHSDGKYRISIETFYTKERALSFLDMIRKNGENPLFKDAWIFEAKWQ